MQISDQANQTLHKKLPIDPDEKVIAIYRHHWFAYVASWSLTILIVLGIVGVAWLLTTGDSPVAQYRSLILSTAAFFGVIVLLGGVIPAYLRSQEQLVLTEESLLKLLKPTIFSHKVDQLGLQHVADVSVSQDFFGTMLGYGKLTIETPGEQRAVYDFSVVPSPTAVAQEISETKENFDAALQGGRLQTTLGSQQMTQINPQEYQEFLKYQQMVKIQQGQASVGQNDIQPQSPQGSQGNGPTPQQ